MKTLFRVIFLVSISSIIKAQNCDCLTEFDFIKSYYETNSPAYHSKTSQQIKDYKKKVAAIKDKILKKKPDAECIFYLQQYVRLLKDHHSNVEQVKFNLKSVDETDSIAVSGILNSEVYKKQKTITLSNEVLERIKTSKDPIEGIYHDSKNDFKIAIVKNDNSVKDYKGIVLETTSGLWKWGFVKMELTKIMDNFFNITMYSKSFQKVCGSSVIRNGNIYNFGWSKENSKAESEFKTPFEFRVLNDSVNYIRLSSFDGKLYSSIDSFYNANKNNIISKKFLLIDLRNNGGGSEQCYNGLLPYIYSKPIQETTVEIYATPENKKRYLDRIVEMKYDSVNYSADQINSTNYVLQRMMTSGKSGFIGYKNEPSGPFVINDAPKYPAKVIVLQNAITASSAEGFIIKCLQSNKVITMGENTGGYAGYGNVFESKTASGCYKIINTTLRYKEFFKYEYRGIPPKKYLSSDADWIGEALNQLKN
jgi:hypothetical protein